MRFMILVKATKDSEAGVRPPDELFTAMADYHEKLAKAGVLLDGSGLQPTSKGWRIRYSGDKRTVVDGCEIEVRQLFELEDFGDGEVFDRFREIGIGNQK